jgi:iron complex transport system permease protein
VSAAAPAVPRARRIWRPLVLAGLAATLVVAALLSVSVGARGIALDDVWHLLWHKDGSQESIIVHDLRIPRTVLGLLVGAALGVAGALMQGLTRNPLADPGLLGVTAGAAAGVVTGAALFDLTDPLQSVWFAFAGAAAASVIVYGVGAAGRAGATPVRLTLAGVALSFTLLAYVQGVVLVDRDALDEFRFWQVGSLAGHPPSLNAQMAPFIVAGLLIALALGRSMNAVGLGDERGRSLGARPGRIRALGAVAITLLCGAATAAAGPIVFVGLAVPHAARAIAGPDHRWVIAYSLLLAPALLLIADVIGRIVTRPGELQVGVVTALLGAPLFIAIVRRRRIAHL